MTGHPFSTRSPSRPKVPIDRHTSLLILTDLLSPHVRGSPTHNPPFFTPVTSLISFLSYPSFSVFTRTLTQFLVTLTTEKTTISAILQSLGLDRSRHPNSQGTRGRVKTKVPRLDSPSN